jgi:hypothetical protein
MKPHLLRLVVFCVAVGMSPRVGADTFEERFQSLERLDVRKLPREAVVRAAEQALSDFADHPKRARIMLFLSARFEESDPHRGIQPDRAAVIDWARKAVEAAEVGSETWCEAQFRVADRIHEKAPQEARGILLTVEAHSTDPVVRAQVVYELESVALTEHKSEEAEQLCRRLRDWYNHAGNMPKEPLDKGRIDRLRASAAAMLMWYFAQRNTPKAQRRAKIEALARQYPSSNTVWEARARIYEMLAKAPDVPAATGAPPVNRAGQYAAVVVVVLLALATIGLFRSVLRRGRSIGGSKRN